LGWWGGGAEKILDWRNYLTGKNFVFGKKIHSTQVSLANNVTKIRKMSLTSFYYLKQKFLGYLV
jgi:hypothetical protein